MKRKTRSLFEEIQNLDQTLVDKDHFVKARFENIVASINNIQVFIKESYEEDVANDLLRRMALSIKSGNPKKFLKGLEQLNENK